MFKTLMATMLLSLPLYAQNYENFDERIIQAPFKESNEISLYGRGCRTKQHAIWDSCYTITRENAYIPAGFRFFNRGINDIVPEEGFSVGREFEFMFEDLARSDLGLLVWDSPSEIERHGHLKMMYFFPRHILPAIRHEYDHSKDELIVTLPTKEEVVFNGKTYEILRGALTEGPIKTASSGAALAPNVQYNGSGVVVEANALADWPVGVAARSFSPLSSKYSTIKKKGFKNCQVPTKDLWYTDNKKGGAVFFTKSLISNDAFDRYVQKKCGFSIY